MARIHEGWRQEQDFDFERAYRRELNAFGEMVIRLHLQSIEQQARMLAGLEPLDVEALLPSNATSLVLGIHHQLREAGIAEEELRERTGDFLRSNSLDRVPYMQISSLLFAALARKAAIGGQVRGPLLQAPEEEPAADAAAAEGRYRTLMADRSAKFNAPEGFAPSGTWATTDALVAAQLANHTTTLHYVHGTQDALRWHRLPHPALGPMDGVQWLVFMAAHTRRHVQQIEEVKQAEGYPGR